MSYVRQIARTLRALGHSALLVTLLVSGAAVAAVPGTPVVTDDGATTRVSDRLGAHWTASDAGHQILEYQYRLTRQSATGPLVRDWTSVALATTVTATGLTLTQNESYFFGVRARYGSNVYTATGYSNGITVDGVAPTLTVVDTGAYTNLASSLSASWTGTDAGGVQSYRISIGTTPGATNTKAWTNAGTNTSVTVSNLTLVGGATYFFNVEATDVAGNVRVASADGIVSDRVVPTVAVQDDGDTTMVGTSLHATWTGSDALSGISEYFYALGTASQPELLMPYTSRGTQTSVTVNGLALVNNTTYVFKVKAVDRAGNYAIQASNGIRAQLSGPIVQVVNDSGTYQSNATSLYAAWVASGTGITEYRYAIGTSAGATNVVNWTSVGLNVNVTRTGMSLANGVTYYFAVRAYDSAGRYGSGNSNGIKVDLANPTLGAVIDAGEFSRDAGTLSFSFSGSDAESGVKEYSYSIGTPASLQSIMPWTSSALVTSRTISGLPLVDGELYVISVRVMDQVGHVTTGYSDGITVDVSPPSIVFLEDDGDITALDDELSASWYATDAAGISGYRYAIGTSPEATNIVGWTNAGMSTSVTKTGLSLQQDITYYFTVTATDFTTQSATANTDGILVDGAAPVIGAPSIDGLTGTTATVHWTTDKPTDGLVDYGQTTGYGSQVVDATFSGTHAAILAVLTPGKLYHYRITAHDDSGTTTSTADLTFTTPDEANRNVRLSPSGQSYVDPQALQSAAKMTFRLSNGDVWVGDVNPTTGTFVTSSGLDYRMDTASSTEAGMNGPEFGADVNGWSVFYSKLSAGTVQVWRSTWNGTASVVQQLTTGERHESPLPTTNVALAQTRMLNLIGSWSAGGNHSWFPENSPATQHIFEASQAPAPNRTPLRWLDNGTTLVMADVITGQLFLYDTVASTRTVITNDAGRKITPIAWQAPEYDGETIIAAVVDNDKIGLYRKLGTGYWTRVGTLSIPIASSEIAIATPQAFVASGKSYLALTIQNQPLSLVAPQDGEVWIFDLEDDNDVRYTQRCDDGRTGVVRTNPEAFVGSNDVFIYYNVTTTSGVSELWSCRAGIAVADQHPVVDTTAGLVQGLRYGGTDGFLSIPFAAPPVGNLRWHVTQPVAPWSDVRSASVLPPRCPQPDRDTPDAIIGEEDCLYLNVWAPADRAPGAPLPVMFFVHGGGNRTGGSSDPLSVLLDIQDSAPEYDGTVLADRGNVIVVTVQYRLSALGYLSDPSLANDSPTATAGNYGTYDLLEALRWVQDNIAGFGGDASRVMLFGQSGGASNVGLLIASPLAAGLFSRALMESGSMSINTAAQGDAISNAFVEEMGLAGSPNLEAALRALPLSRIVLADVSMPTDTEVSPFGPAIDGEVVSDQPLNIVMAGTHNHVPLVIGTNSAENTSDIPALSLSDFTTMSAALVPANRLAELLALYPTTAFPSLQDTYIAMWADQRFTTSTRTIARLMADHQVPETFRYYFSRQLSSSARRSNGAYHGSELLSVFQHMDGVHFSANADDREVEALVLGYWTRFAATGNPNNPTGPVWPTYDTTNESYMDLDVDAAAGTRLLEEKCDFWESINSGQ